MKLSLMHYKILIKTLSLSYYRKYNICQKFAGAIHYSKGIF